MRETTLKSLIKKQKERIKLLQNGVVDGDVCDYCPDVQAYYDWVEFAQRFLDLHFKGDKYIDKFCKLCDENFSLAQQRKLLSILKAFDALPTIIHDQNNIKMEKGGTEVNVTVNNNNSQSQNQEQSMLVQQFLDAFRDELTGRQLKELRSVIAESDNDLHKAKPKIIDKLMEFGGNVASNILATILTNSAFWQCL